MCIYICVYVWLGRPRSSARPTLHINEHIHVYRTHTYMVKLIYIYPPQGAHNAVRDILVIQINKYMYSCTNIWSH